MAAMLVASLAVPDGDRHHAGEPALRQGLVGAKANAYLRKSDSTEQLIVTVRAAVLDPEGADAVVGMPPSMLEVTRKGDEGVLSARELEILLLAARGLSNARIASSLYLAQGTVKRHLANVNAKMGVHSRGEAARAALLKDWITIEEIREEEGAPEEEAEGEGAS
jgi:DNA-binding NarL/FixJ family response regulator